MSNGILIVDDNPRMRGFMRRFVETRGYKVCAEACSGLDAIQCAEGLTPDLVLMDLSMPDMNGAEAAPILKRMMPQVPIIIFTIFEFGDAIAKAVGVDVVLSKPDGGDQLEAHLKRLLKSDSAPMPNPQRSASSQ